MKLGNGLLLVTTALVLLLGAGLTFADQAPAAASELRLSVDDSKAEYNGTLRVYVLEERSTHWDASDGQPYNNALLSFATELALTIPDAGRFEDTYGWYGGTQGFVVTESNIKAIAAVFDDDPVQADVYPPNHIWFNAYPVEACAGAKAGEIGQNYVGTGWTHSVFLECATASWCGHCPPIRSMLAEFSDDPTMHIYYTALVDDENDNAHDRIYDIATIQAFPTTFLDAGAGVSVGDFFWDDDSLAAKADFRDSILQEAARPVADLDLLIKVDWISTSLIDVHVAIGNGVPANNPPAIPTLPAYLESNPDTSATFEANGTDPDGQPLWYQCDYGNGYTSEWLGPFDSGTPASMSYAWPEAGEYDCRVRARDRWEETTGWSDPMAVSITPASCCVGLRGNVDCDALDVISLGDLTVMIDILFVSFGDPCCWEEANVDASQPEGPGSISLGDLTVLIDALFVSFDDLPPCP